jgi:hypothetical protein
LECWVSFLVFVATLNFVTTFFLCSSGFWQSFEIKEPPVLWIFFKENSEKNCNQSVLGFKAFQRTCGFHPEITGKAKNG